ncbi:MAG: flagellar basal body P-ring formation protein FlgA [Phycisphaeraceae bacterium]|nr:flagellar basal body P-ring formation protein FlgA [Phycisphaeraceae bacterium]
MFNPFLASPAIAQHTGQITLRPAVRVTGNGPVTLADIADLSGHPAEALAGVVVLETASASWATLDLDAIRAAIDAQARPVWGLIALSGSACRVRSIATAADAAPPGAGDGEASPTPPTDPTTVRAVVEHRLAAALGCTVADLRLEFDDRDTALLAMSAIGRTVDAQPTGFSERMPLRITIYEHEQILRAEQVRVGVLVRRHVAVASSTLARGVALTEAHVQPDTRWIAPDIVPIGPDEAIGMVVRGRVAAGTPITRRDVETPLLVQRGEELTAHSVSGAIALQLPVRALEDGREGDVIRCTPLSRSTWDNRSRDDRELLVRVAARGVGVVVEGRDQPADSDPPDASNPNTSVPDAPARPRITIEPLDLVIDPALGSAPTPAITIEPLRSPRP